MEKLTPLLQDLAAKLNVTVDHLWQCMIQQAMVNGMTNLILYIVGILAIIAMVIIWKKIYSTGRKIDEAGEDSENWDIAAMISGISFFIAIIIIVILICTSMTDTITSFANPEYWALKQILQAVH